MMHGLTNSKQRALCHPFLPEVLQFMLLKDETSFRCSPITDKQKKEFNHFQNVAWRHIQYVAPYITNGTWLADYTVQT